MSIFGESDFRCLSNFLQTHIFWNFDHISRTSNQIIYRNIWLAKVIINHIMTAQVLFFDVFSEKDPHLNAVEWCFPWKYSHNLNNYIWKKIKFLKMCEFLNHPYLQYFRFYRKLHYFLKPSFQQLKCGFSMKNLHRARYQEIPLKSSAWSISC